MIQTRVARPESSKGVSRLQSSLRSPSKTRAYDPEIGLLNKAETGCDSMSRIIPFLVGLGILLASEILHGQWTNRWSISGALEAACTSFPSKMSR